MSRASGTTDAVASQPVATNVRPTTAPASSTIGPVPRPRASADRAGSVGVAAPGSGPSHIAKAPVGEGSAGPLSRADGGGPFAQVRPEHRPLVEFLVAFDKALSKGDRAYVAKHAKFPVSITWREDDMDAKTQTDHLPNAAALIKARGAFQMEESFLSALLEGATHAGEECPKGEKQGDRSGGPLAIQHLADGFVVVYARGQCAMGQSTNAWEILVNNGDFLLKTTGFYDPRRPLQ